VLVGGRKWDLIVGSNQGIYSRFSKYIYDLFEKSSTEYDLILQNDLNSKGNTQWFYFTVVNLPQNVEITFNIVNLLKSDSLFNYGMQPVVLS
jgi:hypothetical protein